MFNVRVDNIREQTTNGPTYMKGRSYYRNGHVKYLSYDEEKGLILAQVLGSQPYSVRIILSRDGLVHDASCTCSAFTSYWGYCKHITAALLYCVDFYSRGKTHISPSQLASDWTDPLIQPGPATLAGQPGLPVQPLRTPGSGSSGDPQPAMVQPTDRMTAGSEMLPTGLPAREPAAPSAPSGLPFQRRSRLRTRDFLAQINHAARALHDRPRQRLELAVVLFCGHNASTLPFLSLAVAEARSPDQIHPIDNIEQFVAALARNLPLELGHGWQFDPLEQSFGLADQPMLDLLLDAYENDYKAAFGTSHAASRDSTFVLNASRFARFLQFAVNQPHYTWRMVRQPERQMIRLREEQLPVELILRLENTPDGAQIRLEMLPGPQLLQLTASRNVYRVDDMFYVPPRSSILIIEPILAHFQVPGVTALTLTREEAADLLTETRPVLQPYCPIHIDPALARNIIDTPLAATVTLENLPNGLKADVRFRYGAVALIPFETHNSSGEGPVVLRDRCAEQAVISYLEQAGFKRQGLTWRLDDVDGIFQFLATGLPDLSQRATIESTAVGPLPLILPAPAIRLSLNLKDGQDTLCLTTGWDSLPGEERQTYCQALRERRPYYLTRQGNYRRVDDSQVLLLPLFDQLDRWGHNHLADRLELPRHRVLALDQFFSATAQADQALARLVDIHPDIRMMASHLREPGSLSFRLPPGLGSILRPYQKTGFQWLCTLDYYGLGGILADDMGLGKTLQTIAYIAFHCRKCRRPALIVAPTSLIYNWQREFEQFAPDLAVLVHDGSRAQRVSRLEAARQYVCIITSYALLRRDIDDIGAIRFSSFFLDEAQNIKNPETLNARSVKQVRADRMFALTGTPIENALSELWSIFDFVLPGYLYTQNQFQALYEGPLSRGSQPDLLADLHRQITPFILRRMKKDVLQELPAKIETRTVCDMTEEQQRLYQALLLQSRQAFEQEIGVNGYARSQIFILALLTRLRQVCCHPALVNHAYSGSSGKLLLLEELLAECLAAGHRVLVFSQFTQMLELIRKRQADLGQSVFYLDGQVSAEDRLDQVERFNSGEGRVFLISLRAGGTGLNLVGADTVIHFDPWWNPAVQDQATDRAYRIGQENVVQVFKLYTRQTIEEKILALQAKKQNLIDAVIKPGQDLLTHMTLEEVRSLFEP